jgi:hypothetical protein
MVCFLVDDGVVECCYDVGLGFVDGWGILGRGGVRS